MPYVQYDQEGAVTGLYASPQPGLAETFLATTDPAVLAYLSPPPSLDDVKAECKRRILAVVSIESQSNINGYINSLNATVTTGGTLTDAQKADIALFGRAMAWIDAMRTACAALVGNLDYGADSHWTPLDADLATFAARF